MVVEEPAEIQRLADGHTYPAHQNRASAPSVVTPSVTGASMSTSPTATVRVLPALPFAVGLRPGQVQDLLRLSVDRCTGLIRRTPDETGELTLTTTAGSTSYDDGTFTVRGAGVDLTVNNQGMTGQFVRQSVTGDGTVTARLVSRTGAGVIVTGGTSAQLMLRRTVAGASAFSGTTTVQLPLLLRLKRAGTTLASGEIPGFGDAPFHVGLVVCSRSPQALGTARFEEVSITPD